MRILGIDYGTKRVGVAIGDTDTKVAVPLCVIEVSGLRDQVLGVVHIIEQEHIELIVVGMPTNVDGTQSEIGDKVDKFIKELKTKIKIKIKTQDERFSTKQIEQITKEYGFAKKGIDKDSAAAALILQSWLDRYA